MPKSGNAQKNRAARAQSGSDEAGRNARKELMRVAQKPAGQKGTPLTAFGMRNKHLCEARKAQRTGDKAKADREMALAAALAPLTIKEKLNVERAH